MLLLLFFLGSVGGTISAATICAMIMTAALVISAHAWRWRMTAKRQAPIQHYTQSRMYYRILQKVIGLPAMHTQLATTRFGVHNAMHQPALVLAEIVQTMPNKRVLELGCGKGGCTLFLADLLPDHEFVGIDVVPHHIDAACRSANGRPNVRFRRADMTDQALTKEIGTYDLVFACESLCYINSGTETWSLCENAAMLLRPNGRLMVFDLFRTATDCTAREQMALWQLERGIGIPALQSRDTWCRAMGNHGLVLLSSRNLTDAAIPFWRRLLWFVGPFLVPPLSLVLLVAPMLASNLLGVLGTTTALWNGSVEYSMLVLQKGCEDVSGKHGKHNFASMA